MFRCLFLRVVFKLSDHLLHCVDKVDECAGRAWVGHQQQDLGPPELHVGLSGVQQQQVLPHLEQQGFS